MHPIPRQPVQPLPTIVISVVSHQQGSLVAKLLSDIDTYWDTQNISLILTVNVPEDLPFSEADFSFPILTVRNEQPKGFGANHNSAFKLSHGELFCVINPDIRARRDPLPGLCRTLARRTRLSLVAPRIQSPDGHVEDSARRVITPRRILQRALGRGRATEYAMDDQEPLHPDWVAGMFMLVHSQAFARVGGFNERYFMYCEDADLCVRLWFTGRGVAVDADSEVVHAARRASHSSIKHLYWHVSSLLRFFITFRAMQRKLRHAA